MRFSNQRNCSEATAGNRRGRLVHAAPAGEVGRGPRAFTLIEMILVMALLMVVLGVAFPSLQHFFRGRNLDSEARRFLSLTRYGRSRAISEGVPMTLWMDINRRMYGLQAQTGYMDTDSNAVSFTVGEGLELRAELPVVTFLTQSNLWTQMTRTVPSLPTIRFLPDGLISENSPSRIFIRQGQDEGIWIEQSATRQSYEIQTSHTFKRR